MRDEHRFREKIELSLENRQVTFIAAVAVLLLGAAFSVGVLVGKRLASRAAVPAVVDDLEALDAQQQSPGHGRTEATRPGTGASAPGTGASGPEIGASRPGTGASAPGIGATRPGTGASAPSDPPRDVPAMVETAKTRDSSGTSSVAPLPTAETTVLAPPPPARPPPVRSIPAPPPTATVRPGARTAYVSAPQTAFLPAPPREAGRFTVQVGATQDRAEARELVGRVTKAGLRPYVLEVKLPGRGLWYRVRVGAFGDRAAADQYRKDVERELHAPAVVMPSG